MTVTLINRGKHSLVHQEYNLLPHQTIEVPENIAELWLNIEGIEKYIDPAEAKAKEVKAAEVTAKLEKENEALKAELEKLKAEAKAKEAKAEK